MIAILTPICETKSYCFEQYVRGVRQLAHPKEEIFWLFVLQQQGLGALRGRIERLREVVESEYHGVEVIDYAPPFPDQFFDPRYSENLSWRERAQIAGSLRAVGFDFVKEVLPEATHVLSLGCDVVLNQPEDLDLMLDLGKPLVSGILVARTQGFPLVLRYDRPRWREIKAKGDLRVHTTDFWSTWVDYPKDRPFQADWAGMDVLLVDRRVVHAVDLHAFSLADHGLGEDGWYCVEAEDLTGEKLWFDPHVAPYHVDLGDRVMWAGEDLPRPGVVPVCRRCGARGVPQARSYSDVAVVCVSCYQPFYLESWEHESELTDPVAPTLLAWG